MWSALSLQQTRRGGALHALRRVQSSSRHPRWNAPARAPPSLSRPSSFTSVTTAPRPIAIGSSGSFETTTRCQSSSSSSMERAETLEEVMAAIDEQAMEDDHRRSIENPKPWFTLLHHPSRAAWRSTDHLLGGSRGGGGSGAGAAADDEALSSDESHLSRTQFNILQHSGRTNKQLKRTYRRIMETHKKLAVRRERERRLAANLTSAKKAGVEDGTEGSIKDEGGRRVGDWKEKKSSKRASAPASLSDDPSVALSLSAGLSKTSVDVGDMDPDAAATTNNGRPTGGRGISRITSRKIGEKPVGYGPEQTLTHVRFRLGQNYAIVKRVLSEAQSLLGGRPPEGSKRKAFRPRRVLDFGSGVGSSGAAALDVFGVSRGANNNSSAATEGIDWIHSIDASQCMREATEKVLKSALEGTPWESEPSQAEEDEFDEDMAEYDRIARRMSGQDDPRRLERSQKRMQRWERSWEKRTDFRTRLTFGESIVDNSSFFSNQVPEKDDRPSLPWQKQLDEQRRRTMQKKERAMGHRGSFDLILCTYTLSEFQNVPSSLSAVALLWEKLAPDGVMVFVEPGTPDGFSMLRSVRSMLLESCPPPEIRKSRSRAKAMAHNTKPGGEGGSDGGNESPIADDSWPEECHVIAPCTHNGTCPMVRHQRNHIKRNSLFAKYEATAEPNEDDERTNEEEEEAGEEESAQQNGPGEKKSSGMMADWEKMSPEEKAEMKTMFGVEDMSDAELEEMMKQLDEEMNSDDEYDDEEDDAEDDDDDEDSESDTEDDADTDADAEYYNIDGVANEQLSKPTMKQTNVFDTAFCSFVHNFPGGTSRKKGEKFSYLVVQKNISSSTDNSRKVNSVDPKQGDLLDEVDVVELLSKSVYHAQQVKGEDMEKRKDQKDFNRHGFGMDTDFHKEYFHKTYDTYHKEQSHEVLQTAVRLEDEYLDSTVDSLGLEMLSGDAHRKGWGRLIRAPLKRKGHVLLDYCSAGCGGRKNGCTTNKDRSDADDLPDGTQGRITRQKVSRGWSAKAAPGCHAAARKARWGGLWPDLSERVGHVKRKDETERAKKEKRAVAS